MGNAHVRAPPTEQQAVGLEISKMLASVPSIVGAAFIVQHVVRSRERRQRPFSRIMLGMSTMDLLYALVSACSSSIAPKEVNWLLHFANGTWGTCEAFGFMETGASLASICYNATLSLHYLLTIRYGWSEQNMRGIELWLHLMPLVIGWGVAIPGLPLNYYNPTATGCNLTAYPFGCKRRGGCTRGDKALRYRLLLFFGILWTTFGFLVICMTLIYASIAKVNQSTVSLSTPQEDSSHLQQSAPTAPIENSEWQRESSSLRRGLSLGRLKREFATQALLYCIAFAITWVFGTLATIFVEWTEVPIYMPVVFLNAILSPLQGFWNAFIYVRPRYLRYRKKQKMERIRQDRSNSDSRLSSRGRIFQAFAHALSVVDEDVEGEGIPET